MKNIMLLAMVVLLSYSCKTNNTLFGIGEKEGSKNSFTIAFGSCNKHNITNNLWDDVLATDPDVWIWGGDIVYADTGNMNKLRQIYSAQNQVAEYKELKTKVPIIGTWDDHDYGLNDGGSEFDMKKGSQQEFLDFIGVPKNSPRRKREGVYAVHNYNLPQGKIKILVLDTRFFRTPLTKDTLTKKRFRPNGYGEGTLLGKEQWEWLEKELKRSEADFNILVSSVQFLSNMHGFECWGNFPHEVDRLTSLISDSKAKGVIVLSGDRHISEFSKIDLKNKKYPLIDFTSSGLTHVYDDFSGEQNPYRIGKVVHEKSFGLLNFNFKSKSVHFVMMGDGGKVLGKMKQVYE